MSNELKSTPGPWRVHFGNETGYPRTVAPVLRWSSLNKPSTTEGLANAHLIAAAPEMYAALKALHDWLAYEDGPALKGMLDQAGVDRYSPEGERIWREYRSECMRLCKVAGDLGHGAAALAKARGETEESND